jgi:hypothetical protein
MGVLLRELARNGLKLSWKFSEPWELTFGWMFLSIFLLTSAPKGNLLQLADLTKAHALVSLFASRLEKRGFSVYSVLDFKRF